MVALFDEGRIYLSPLRSSAIEEARFPKEKITQQRQGLTRRSSTLCDASLKVLEPIFMWFAQRTTLWLRVDLFVAGRSRSLFDEQRRASAFADSKVTSEFRSAKHQGASQQACPPLWRISISVRHRPSLSNALGILRKVAYKTGVGMKAIGQRK